MWSLKRAWEQLLPSRFPSRTPESESTRIAGQRYEAQARHYLEGCGYSILQENYRTRSGEIDVIATRSSILVFVEVRFRSHPATLAQYTVDNKKQQKLWNTAAHYLRHHPWGGDVRFDVIAINGDQLEHYEDAFRGEL